MPLSFFQNVAKGVGRIGLGARIRVGDRHQLVGFAELRAIIVASSPPTRLQRDVAVHIVLELRDHFVRGALRFGTLDKVPSRVKFFQRGGTDSLPHSGWFPPVVVENTSPSCGVGHSNGGCVQVVIPDLAGGWDRADL